MKDAMKKKLQMVAIVLLGGSVIVGALVAMIGGGIILSKIGV